MRISWRWGVAAMLGAAMSLVAPMAAAQSGLSVEQRLARFEASERTDAALQLLSRGDRHGAIVELLKAMPITDDESVYRAYFAKTEAALFQALNSRTCQLPLTEVVHFRVSPDGTRGSTASLRVSGASEISEGIEAAKIWDLENCTLVAQLLPPEASVREGHTLGAPVFSSDSARVALGDATDGRAHVWDTRDGRKLAQFDLNVDNILFKFVFSTDNRYLAVSSGRFYVLDILTGGVAFEASTRFCEVASPAGANTPGKMYYWTATIAGVPGCGDTPTMRFFELDLASMSPRELWSYEFVNGFVNPVMSPYGDMVMVALLQGGGAVLDLQTGREIALVPASFAGEEYAIYFTRDNRLLGSVDVNNQDALYFDLETQQAVQPDLSQRHIFSEARSAASGAAMGLDYWPGIRYYGTDIYTGGALIDRALETLSAAEQDAVAQQRARW